MRIHASYHPSLTLGSGRVPRGQVDCHFMSHCIVTFVPASHFAAIVLPASLNQLSVLHVT
jgi:hypothetical protein